MRYAPKFAARSSRCAKKYEIGALRGEIEALRNEIRSEIGGLRSEMNELRDRVARIEGLLEAVFMRRDLTPLPEPPPGDPPSKAA